MAFRAVTRGDATTFESFSCTGRSSRHGAQIVEREIRTGKSLRRAELFPDDRFVGIFRGDILVACGYHRHEPELDTSAGRPGRYLLFLAVSNTFQSQLLDGEKVSDRLLRLIHIDIAQHASATQIVAVRAHPGHAASRALLLRNGYVEVSEAPSRRDALFIAEL